MRYWLGVVSKQHVQRGVVGGFAQVCHGKKGPLSKMKAGDGFVYYSPKMVMGENEPCKCFTAIGMIKTGNVYQVEMTPDFHPFRIDISYFPCHDLPLDAVFDLLELTQKKAWGMQLRRGLLELSAHDFFILKEKMV
jgi:hypothetical protein